MANDTSSDWPIPRGLIAHNNATWTTVNPSHILSEIQSSNTQAKQAVFHFPLHTTSGGAQIRRLFCISRGLGEGHGARTLSPWGAFHMTQSDRAELVDCVEVKVVIEYDYSAVIFAGGVEDVLKVCELKRETPGKENQYGIGIFTRSSSYRGSFQETWGAHFHARVIITLPKSRNTSEVVKLKNFETDMPLFSHQIDNLGSSVHFRSISLRSSNAPILVDSLNARKINIKTSNAPIEGSLTASSFLNLTTNNGYIRTSVLLQNNDLSRFTELVMNSSNGPITSFIVLSSPVVRYPTMHRPTPEKSGLSDSGRGGNFSISASTENSPLTLTVPSAPPLCNLHLRAFSSLAPVEISLPETYEGTFELQTSGPGIPSMVNTACPTTSENGERRMILEENGEAGHRKGWVCLTDEGRWRGEIRGCTSMAPAILQL